MRKWRNTGKEKRRIHDGHSRNPFERTVAIVKPPKRSGPIFRLCSFLFYQFVLPLLYANDKAVLGLSIRGRKNLRALRNRGAVLVCNHVHTLDCTFVGLLAAPRRVTFTAAAVNFRPDLVGGIVRLLGAVPVPAPESSPCTVCRFVRQAAHAVRSGRLVCVYPEGELLPYRTELRGFKDGAFLIAALAGAPVVPITVTFRRRKGLWRLLKRKPCLTVTAGKPLSPVPRNTLRDTAADLGRRAWDTMGQTLRDSEEK